MYSLNHDLHFFQSSLCCSFQSQCLPVYLYEFFLLFSLYLAEHAVLYRHVSEYLAILCQESTQCLGLFSLTKNAWLLHLLARLCG